MTATAENALASKAWPFQEASKVLERYKRGAPDKGHVLFETGYGPSGLPHIGTFAEVVRTSMVRRAFSEMSDIPTRLIAFSDDMDGLRKVPENVPQKEMLRAYIDQPLTQVPDPFGTHESFGHHNNARLRAFLDQFGFDYEFVSSTECYRAGQFDDALLTVLRNYDKVMQVMLPSLREERRKTYSPFLPLSEKTGKVLQVPLLEVDATAGTIRYRDEDGEEMVTAVTGGRCKLQWKVDWAMRWYALDVDYEMSGKDLIDSVKLSSAICRLLGARPPVGFTYEMFLDDKGEKISKSIGNGLSVDEWLRYGTQESLKHYMFQSPRKARRLHFDVIPKAVDEYFSHGEKYHDQEPMARYMNPLWHIHGGDVSQDISLPVSFALLLNLAAACNSENPSVLWGFVSRYAPGVTAADHPKLDELIGHAIAYYQDFIKPTKRYRAPSANERAAIEDLERALAELAADSSGPDIQNVVYEIGKRHNFENLRDWFKALYEVLFGQSQGPRLGSFIALYGIEESRALISDALSGAFTDA